MEREMAIRVDSVAIGAASARLVKSLVQEGRPILLAVVVEASQLGADRSRLESGVARSVLDGYIGARGSTTSRLRHALRRADHWLESQTATGTLPARPSEWRIGVGVVVADPSGFTAACVGPVALIGSAGGRPSAAVASPSAPLTAASRPLGAPGEPEPAWIGSPATAGLWLLLADATGTGALGSETRALHAIGSPTEAGAVLRQALGPEAAGVWLRWSEVAPAGAAEVESEGPGSHVWIAAPSRRPRPGTDALDAGLRGAGSASAALAGRWARAGWRVARALLPEPDPEAPSAPRAGRPTVGRLWGVVALLLPIAVIALALLGERPHAPATPSPPSAGPDSSQATQLPSTSSAVAPAPDMQDTGTAPDGARVVGLAVMAGLGGSPDDERQLVAADGQPYVLDVTRHRVARLQDGVWVTALERGAAVGDRVVGNPIDLAWLPPAAGGAVGPGRVVALDAAGEVWALAGGTIAHVPVAAEPRRVLAERLAGVAGAVFLLDRARDAVVRFGIDAGAALSFTAPGQDWLASPVDLADAVDIGADGAVYILWRDGSLARFASGVHQPLPADELDRASFEAAGLYVAASADRLLVADRTNGRLLVLSKAGALLDRLARPVQPAAADEARRTGRFENLHAVWWDEPAGRLYVVCGDALLAGPYEP